MRQVVEALYAIDPSPKEWLMRVAQALRPFIDRDGLGVVGAFYHCPDPCSFVLGRPVGEAAEDHQKILTAGAANLTPEYVADKYLGRSCSLSSELRGWNDIPLVRDGSLRALNVSEILTLTATESDGRGCAFFSFQARRRPLSEHAHLEFTRIGRHLDAAHRLRRRFATERPSSDIAEAVLDPAGRVHEARGIAAERMCRDALTRAVQRLEYARARRGNGNADKGMIDSWPAMIEDRWTLIDHLECGGHRYLLAVENAKPRSGVELLSRRERDVLRCAVLGQSAKAIAYELGIAHSTVRVLMTRVMTKMGKNSWREVLANAKADDLH